MTEGSEGREREAALKWIDVLNKGVVIMDGRVEKLYTEVVAHKLEKFIEKAVDEKE